MKLTIHREGYIKIRALENEDGRCGIIGTPCNYKYQVEITIYDTYLLENSFIYDVDNIEKYFADKYNNKVLKKCDCCEVMAMNAVRFFEKEMNGRDLKIKVQISPGNGRWIEAKTGE